MAAASLPQNIKSGVLEYVRLDDGLKKAREEMKAARHAMDECRESIITYMREAEVERLGIKKGSQFLELNEKNLKVRPSAECVKAKIAELMSKNITDPETIYQEISKCGGTKQVWKLSRRSKRTAKPKTATDEPSKKKKRVTITTTETGL